MPENNVSVQFVNNKEMNVPDIIVYKYRTWSNDYHKLVLTERKLYYPSPENLRIEDKNECNLPVDYPEGSSLLNFLYERSLKENPSYTREKHYEHAMYWALNSPLGDKIRREKIVRDNDIEHSKMFGVLSLCKNSTSEYMWNTYADNSTGVCYGFNAKFLFDAFGGGCGNVIYNDELPHIDYVKDKFPINFIKSTYNKLKCYEPEDEFRFHKAWFRKTVSSDDRNMIYV